MDAPPEHEDSRPFIKVAGLLQEAGLHAPRILARDLDQGFLLLTDLGRQTYLQAIVDGAEPAPLMQAAITALVAWQAASRPGMLPAYDRALLQRELDLFPDWYVKRHLGVVLSAGQRQLWQRSCEALVASALAQPRVWVHRDYMPRNLMLSEPNPGIIDFQDAVEGPLTYDVVSLFKDAFWSWPAEQVQRWLVQYHGEARRAGLPVGELNVFLRDCDWMGVQRHLKVLGIFARINYRDGKAHYLADTPRFVGYIREILPRHEPLQPLARLFDELGLGGQDNRA